MTIETLDSALERAKNARVRGESTIFVVCRADGARTADGRLRVFPACYGTPKPGQPIATEDGPALTCSVLVDDVFEAERFRKLTEITGDRVEPRPRRHLRIRFGR